MELDCSLYESQYNPSMTSLNIGIVRTAVSSNPSLTPDAVSTYYDCPWDWIALSNNLNVIAAF